MSNQQKNEPYIVLNVFTAVEGHFEDLVNFQLAEMRDLSEGASTCGWLRNRVYRAADKNQLIVVTEFRSAKAQQAWAATPQFQRHVDKLAPLVADVTSTPLMLLASHGDDE